MLSHSNTSVKCKCKCKLVETLDLSSIGFAPLHSKINSAATVMKTDRQTDRQRERALDLTVTSWPDLCLLCQHLHTRCVGKFWAEASFTSTKLTVMIFWQNSSPQKSITANKLIADLNTKNILRIFGCYIFRLASTFAGSLWHSWAIILSKKNAACSDKWQKGEDAQWNGGSGVWSQISPQVNG